MATIFFLGLIQNAGFTLLSRARNSRSIGYHTIAAFISNGIYLLVLKFLVLNLDRSDLLVAYLVGGTLGSVATHWLAMKYFEI